MKSFAALWISSAAAVELTTTNFDELTFGKAVFLKFFSPGCHHCQKAAPAWQSMSEEFKNSESVLIGEVDCAGIGKSLCTSLLINGYPSFRYGEPTSLKEYEGKRDAESLKTIARGLKVECGAHNLELCTPQQKKKLNDFIDMPLEDLDAAIKEKDSKVTQYEKEYQELVQKLQQTFETAKARREQKRIYFVYLFETVSSYEFQPFCSFHDHFVSP